MTPSLVGRRGRLPLADNEQETTMVMGRHLTSSRRGLLRGAVLTGIVTKPFSILQAAPRLPDDPFTLGVASGSPRPDRVVLWTRLAPRPLEGGGMPEEPVSVTWEVAHDEAFRHVVRSGIAWAMPTTAHSVHVEPGELEPGRWYFYRFRVGMAVSPVGRTRTAPAPGARVDRFRLAVASCQQYEQGFFTAYRAMARRDLDLVIHVGDYIYENSWGAKPPVRRHNTPGVVSTLAGFRDRYAQYKADPALQAAHAAAPWLSIWDDHEVANDYTSDMAPSNPDPTSFLRTRAAAYQAYYEHMPLPASARPIGPNATIYDRYRFGDMVDMLLLDDRQYRSPHVCVPPGRGNGWYDCPDRHDPSRTMLGAPQERWLAESLRAVDGRWTLVVQQTLMSEVDLNTGGGSTFFMDGWDGYAAARGRLLDAVATHRPPNPLVLGGDIHCFCAADLKRNFRADRSEVLATEFVCSSITSEGPPLPAVQAALAQNPHLRFVEGERRGFLTMEFGPGRCEVGLEAVEDARDPNSVVGTLRRFICEPGRAGINL